MQQISYVITNMSTEKRSKDERREFKRKLDSMEEKEDSPEDISVTQDEQPPLKQFEEVTEGDLNELMM